MNNEDELSNLPSVRWKMMNLQQMSETKHKVALETLRKTLWQQ